MVHISKLSNRRVEKCEDVVNIGDMIWVKVIEIDEKGRVNLSYKDALRDIERNPGLKSEPALCRRTPRRKKAKKFFFL